MRITHKLISCLTLVIVWLCVGLFADFNNYIELPNGHRVEFEQASVFERITYSFVVALVAGLFSVSASWVWHRLKRTRS